jgi:carbon monoxide dehydrogenase subunit G
MEMNGSQRIPAPKDKVWAALNDPDVLKACIPGCQSLEMTAPNEMTATVIFKVGPVRATFGPHADRRDQGEPEDRRLPLRISGMD